MTYTPYRPVLLVLALALAACGVEVGNPHKPKPGTGGSSGAISVALADAPADDLKHVYFNLAALSVVPRDESAGERVTVGLLTSGKVDALSLSNGKALDLATDSSLAAGTYDGVVLELAEDDPASLVDEQGNEHPLPFSDSGHGIYVPQEFEVAGGETLSLTLHVDLRRSIKRHDDGERRFEFGPVASLNHRGEEGTINGTAPTSGLVEVCAYLRRQPREDGEQRHGRVYDPGLTPPPPDGDPRRPPKFVIARQPPSVEHGAPFAADTSSSCANAFATAPVRDGKYSLSQLWPGEYHLAFFFADGSPLPPLGMPPPDIPVGPGMTVEVPAHP